MDQAPPFLLDSTAWRSWSGCRLLAAQHAGGQAVYRAGVTGVRPGVASESCADSATSGVFERSVIPLSRGRARPSPSGRS